MARTLYLKVDINDDGRVVIESRPTAFVVSADDFRAAARGCEAMAEAKDSGEILHYGPRFWPADR